MKKEEGVEIIIGLGHSGYELDKQVNKLDAYMFGYFTQYYNYHYYSNCNYYVNSQTYASNNYYVSMTQLATEVCNLSLPFSGHVCAN